MSGVVLTLGALNAKWSCLSSVIHYSDLSCFRGTSLTMSLLQQSFLEVEKVTRADNDTRAHQNNLERLTCGSTHLRFSAHLTQWFLRWPKSRNEYHQGLAWKRFIRYATASTVKSSTVWQIKSKEEGNIIYSLTCAYEFRCNCVIIEFSSFDFCSEFSQMHVKSMESNIHVYNHTRGTRGFDPEMVKS